MSEKQAKPNLEPPKSDSGDTVLLPVADPAAPPVPPSHPAGVIVMYTPGRCDEWSPHLGSFYLELHCCTYRAWGGTLVRVSAAWGDPSLLCSYHASCDLSRHMDIIIIAVVAAAVTLTVFLMGCVLLAGGFSAGST